MKHEEQISMRAPLDMVREAFEQWRSSRTGRERIPEDLWQAAVDLSQSYSLCKIARELRLDYSRLKRRIQESLPGGIQPAQFIELHMGQLLPANHCTVHFRSPGGFELTVNVRAVSELQLPHLIDRFLSQSR